MSDFSARIQEYCGKRWRCPDCGGEHSVTTVFIQVGPDATARLANVTCAIAPKGRILLVEDENTRVAAGDRACKLLVDAGRQVDRFLYPGTVEADIESARKLLAQVRDEHSIIVAVGAGTINDLSKYVADQRKMPCLLVGTAASMNGYASAVAAVLADGVKRTFWVPPPLAVLVDLDVATNAPIELARSGLADLMAKPVSNADWKLATLVKSELRDKGGKTTHPVDVFCPVPYRMVHEAEIACRARAKDINARKPDAMKLLTEGLILSSLSMVVAGHSAPASGGEHYISHYWDMVGHMKGQPHKLHGFQVGLGILASSTLYARMRGMRPSDFKMDELARKHRTLEEEKERIRGAYGPLSDGVIQQFAQKYLDWDRKGAELKAILDNWNRIWDTLGEILVPPSEIKAALNAVGAPATAVALGFTRDDMRDSYRWARYMRSRYTILDLAADLGVLEETLEDVLQESGLLD
ncbi:MAG TPA: sn-glycerol-1-phosphate dehydrogenase [Candidatus Brocadiia bacterium]|nr:sn-glycerol-1-phosphate dehydrogenase [Candidatus Brocadiia bacterium]